MIRLVYLPTSSVLAKVKFGSLRAFVRRHANILMMVLGVFLLTTGVYRMSVAGVGNTVANVLGNVNGCVGSVCFGGGSSGGGSGGSSFSEAHYNDSMIRYAVGNLFRVMEGAFGALIMTIAGLGAIISSAMGAYRMALSMVWVAVGAFTLRAVVSLFFGENFGYYDVGGQAFGSFGSGSGSGSSSGCADGFSVSTDNGHGVCVSNTLIGDVVNGAGNLLSGSGA